MIYLLDTSAAIDAMRSKSHALRERINEAHDSQSIVGLSAIASFELWFGAHRSQDPARHGKAVEAFLSSDIVTFPFDDTAAHFAGRVRAEFSKTGMSIGPYDVLIAGHALALGATLVTSNTREFERVPGLAIENWSA